MSRLHKHISKRESRLLCAVLLTLIIFLMWHFHIAALYNKIKTLKEELTDLNEDKQFLSAFLGQEDIIIADWQKWQNKQEYLDRKIPEQVQSAEVLAELESLFNTSPCTVHNLAIGEIIAEKLHYTLAVRMNLSGSLAEINSLLTALESFPRLLMIDSLTWTSAGNHGLCEVVLNYRLIFSGDSAVTNMME